MPNNIELARISRAMIGNPYWYGTYGTIGSEQLLSDCAKRYPNQFSKKRIETAKARGDFGKRVMDCSGLIKNYLMGGTKDATPVYDAQYDLSANSFHTKATEKGPIGSIPEIIGLGLWKNNHVGVYIGGGKCIEAKGFDYGVVESELANTAFVEWFKIPFIDYVDGAVPEVPEVPEVPHEDPSPVASQEYKVAPGDTLSELASKWGCAVSDIVKFNGIENPDLIKVGQVLRIPPCGFSNAVQSVVWVGTVNTNKDPLRVRSSMSTADNKNVVRLLPKGSKVDIKGDAIGDWYALADGTGYVAAKYIAR